MTVAISYAAFGTKNKTPGNDYIRGQCYMCRGLGGTELDSEYKNTKTFLILEFLTKSRA